MTGWQGLPSSIQILLVDYFIYDCDLQFEYAIISIASVFTGNLFLLMLLERIMNKARAKPERKLPRVGSHESFLLFSATIITSGQTREQAFACTV